MGNALLAVAELEEKYPGLQLKDDDDQYVIEASQSMIDSKKLIDWDYNIVPGKTTEDKLSTIITVIAFAVKLGREPFIVLDKVLFLRLLKLMPNYLDQQVEHPWNNIVHYGSFADIHVYMKPCFFTNYLYLGYVENGKPVIQSRIELNNMPTPG